MPVSIPIAVYNSIATAFGLVMIGHALLSGQRVAPIWYAVVVVFAASAWTLYRVPPRWIARVAVALNSILALLIVVFLASLTLLRDDIDLPSTATAPRVLAAGLGLVLVTTNIRRLLRRWQGSPPR